EGGGWQLGGQAHWDPACAVFAFEYVAKPVVLGINEPDMIAIAKGTEAFHRVAKVLDGHLKNKRFVTGDTLTLADFGIGSAMILAERAHYPVEPYGEIKRWDATLRAPPARQKTPGQSPPPAQAAARPAGAAAHPSPHSPVSGNPEHLVRNSGSGSPLSRGRADVAPSRTAIASKAQSQSGRAASERCAAVRVTPPPGGRGPARPC